MPDELKLVGYRLQVAKDGPTVRLYSPPRPFRGDPKWSRFWACTPDYEGDKPSPKSTVFN